MTLHQPLPPGGNGGGGPAHTPRALCPLSWVHGGLAVTLVRRLGVWRVKSSWDRPPPPLPCLLGPL